MEIQIVFEVEIEKYHAIKFLVFEVISVILDSVLVFAVVILSIIIAVSAVLELVLAYHWDQQVVVEYHQVGLT